MKRDLCMTKHPLFVASGQIISSSVVLIAGTLLSGTKPSDGM